MGIAVFSNNRRFTETTYENEQDLERILIENSELLFGSRSIYLALKNKVESQELGGAVPDGFLFDFTDREDPQFYLVEVELEKHEFMRHIFQQITRFFAFYRNSTSRSKLIERLFEYVNGNRTIRRNFEQFVESTELYKSIKDIVENSQNILIVADGPITEVSEIQDTYTETWGKYVKSAVLKEYSDASERILILNPSFEELKEVESVQLPEINVRDGGAYNEAYHLEDVHPAFAVAYRRIKEHMARLDSRIVFNPQRYYISIRKRPEFCLSQIPKKQAQDCGHVTL
jgi:hypothetical protein